MSLKQLFHDIRLKEIDESVGIVCADCNQSAYYFNGKNSDLFSIKICLICSRENNKGILLEDFVFTLSNHLKNHYTLTKNDDLDSISLKQVLKRFTYDHDDFLEKLSNLLFQNNDFFQKRYRYRSVVDDSFIENCRKEAINKWNAYAKDLKHVRRFTHKHAYQFYEYLIAACEYRENDTSGKEVKFNSVLRKLDKGTAFFRGRLIQNDAHRNTFSSAPEVELGAPPNYLATNNRMSPPGVSFMYTAGDPQTAIAELRPYVNDTIAVGGFVSTKELNFFDFTLLNDFKHPDVPILVDPRKDNYFQCRYMLNSLHELISKPLRANDFSYIETQMFAETIRNYQGGMFDGIIFGSSQRNGGINYVLFGNSNNQSFEDGVTTAEDYCMKINQDFGVKFYQVMKMEASTKLID